MDISENPIEPNQNPEKEPIKTLGKLKKDGTPRKCNLTDEQKAKRSEILAKGREKAHQKRRELELAKKENIPVSKPVPEPVPAPVEEKDESDDEMLEVVRKQKKKKKAPKKKIIIMDESSSSSSEDEIVVKKKKKKRAPTPPPPPPTPTPPPFIVQPKPSIPQPTEEELNKLRQEKIRRYNEKKKQDKLMSAIFG